MTAVRDGARRAATRMWPTFERWVSQDRLNVYVVVVCIALMSRVVTALYVWAFHHGSVYEDDAAYTRMAIEAARGQTESWSDYTHWLYDHTSTMLIPLTALYRVAGTSTLPGQLVLAAVGALVAGLTARLYRPVGGTLGALAVGGLVALLPSQVLLSSVTLKDAPVWAILVGLAILVARPADRSPLATIVTSLAVAALLVLLAHLRTHTTVTAALALFAVSAALCRRRHVMRTASVISVAVLTPWLLGLGPVGLSFIQNHASSVDRIRSDNARGNTAIAAATTTTTAISAGSAPTTTTHTAPTLEDTDGGMTIEYLPHGVFALLFEPVPWRHSGELSLRLAKAEGAVWYPLLALAAIGLLRLRRHFDVLAFPLIMGAGTVLMWGLVEGNVGTAYRHRGEFAWVVCILAALGASSLIEARRLRAAAGT